MVIGAKWCRPLRPIRVEPKALGGVGDQQQSRAWRPNSGHRIVRRLAEQVHGDDGARLQPALLPRRAWPLVQPRPC